MSSVWRRSVCLLTSCVYSAYVFPPSSVYSIPRSGVLRKCSIHPRDPWASNMQHFCSSLPRPWRATSSEHLHCSKHYTPSLRRQAVRPPKLDARVVACVVHVPTEPNNDNVKHPYLAHHDTARRTAPICLHIDHAPSSSVTLTGLPSTLRPNRATRASNVLSSPSSDSPSAGCTSSSKLPSIVPYSVRSGVEEV